MEEDLNNDFKFEFANDMAKFFSEELEDDRIPNTVMIKKFPVDLEEIGLRNLCRNYGDVLKIRFANEKKVAFVEFKLNA